MEIDYVNKTLGGYKPIKEDKYSDYVVIGHMEYDSLRWRCEEAKKDVASIEKRYKELLERKDSYIRAETLRMNEDNYKLSSQVKSLSEANSTLEANIKRLSEEVARERDLNRNLKRIALERANAKRGIRNKKYHDGYIVLSSQQYEEKWTEEVDYNEWRKLNTLKDSKEYSRREFHCASVWKSVIQTPYDASIPYDIVEPNIIDALQNDGVLLELGVEYSLSDEYNGIFSRIDEDDENGMYKWTYSANYKLGFWEVIIYTAKQITVPEHRRPPQKIKK